MEIRISQFYFDHFIKILNSCQFSLFGSEFLTVFWSSLLGSEVSKKKITFLSEFLVGIRNSMVFGFLSDFFLFSAFYMEIRISQFYFDLFIKILNSCQFSLWGSEFLNVLWTSLWGSEFLYVFWTSLWGSELLNVFWTSLWG